MGAEMSGQYLGQIEAELDSLAIKGDPTKLYEELAKAQAEFTPVPKGKVGQVGMQKFKYASYAILIRCVRPALSAHGITILQPLHWRDGRAITTTILAGHGASIQSSFAFKAEFTRKQKDGTLVDDPQEFGSHHTYYRRYQLQAMLGIEGDSDADDLPDVNEVREQAQYVEASKPEPKPAPKASESAVTSPVAVASQKTDDSVQPSEPSTNGKAEKNGKAKPAAKADAKPLDPSVTTKTINETLTAAMKELKWGMDELRAFYKEHVDEKGVERVANLTLDQRQLLFQKLVEVKNVTPF
jgi:ERF superfamily